jgi:hypothetical protein
MVTDTLLLKLLPCCEYIYTFSHGGRFWNEQKTLGGACAVLPLLPACLLISTPTLANSLVYPCNEKGGDLELGYESHPETISHHFHIALTIMATIYILARALSKFYMCLFHCACEREKETGMLCTYLYTQISHSDV